MEPLKPEPLYPLLLHRFADEFSRLGVPVNLIDETLSILFTFHDPENKYTLPAKMAEFTFAYNLDASEEKTKAALKIFLDYYNSVIALIEELELDNHTKRSVRKLDNISKALLDIRGGYTEENRTAIRYWLGNALRGFIARFKVPTKSSQRMMEYVDKTFNPPLASAFHTAVALVGKIGSDKWENVDLELGIAVLFIFTSHVNIIRKTALGMMGSGEFE